MNVSQLRVFESTSRDHYERVVQCVREELTRSTLGAPGCVEVDGGDWYGAQAVEAISADVMFEIESL